MGSAWSFCGDWLHRNGKSASPSQPPVTIISKIHVPVFSYRWTPRDTSEKIDKKYAPLNFKPSLKKKNWKIWYFFSKQLWNCLIFKVEFILYNSISLTLSILTSSGENWSFHTWTSLQNMLYGPQQFCFLSRPYRESSSYVIPMSSCQCIRKFIDQSIIIYWYYMYM